MDYQAIKAELEGGVGVISLNRPAQMNAFNAQMREELRQAFAEFSETARVIVLTGEGRGFCSGQDLGDAVEETGEADLASLLRSSYNPLIEAIAKTPIPIIAAVNGIAAGAGANLALACDIVIAKRSASFLQAFSKIGLIPDASGSYFLPRLIGFQRAMGQTLFAEKVSAEEALAQGMIWEVFEDDAFEAGWRGRAAQLAAGPTKAYGLIKQAMRASAGNDLAAQLEVEAQLQSEAGRSRDFKEGVAAFIEKRAPKFEGR